MCRRRLDSSRLSRKIRTGGVDGAHPYWRGDTHKKHKRDHRPQGDMIASVQVGGWNVGRVVVEFAVEDTLDHPEHVRSSEDNAGRGEDSPAGVMRDGGLHAAGE